MSTARIEINIEVDSNDEGADLRLARLAAAILKEVKCEEEAE